MREMNEVVVNFLKNIGEHKTNQDDYIGEEGLTYCGKCNEKKQTRLPAAVFGKNKDIVVPCICRCQVEENEERKRQEEYENQMKRIRMLKGNSLIDSKLKDISLSMFETTEENKKLYALARKYVDNFDTMYEKKQGIILWGPVGTGKSYTAACIANELLDKMVPVIMTSFVKILQNIQNIKENESDLIKRLNAAKLLIIDDLGTERNTDYALEKVYNIIDSRYRDGKPMILTTNMELRDMQRVMDIRYKRIYDRIFEMCYPVRVAGNSWREKEAAKRFDEMKEFMEG